MQIHSAKIIWKAIYDQQAIRHEITLLQKWLSMLTQTLIHIKQTSNTNSIDNHIDSINKFTDNIIQQALSKAEDIAQSVARKAGQQKNKLEKYQITS